MDKKEFAKVAMALKTYYPRADILPNEEALNLWYAQLSDIDYRICEIALNKWVALEIWPPTIADLRRMAAEVRNGDLPDWGEGWQQVTKAIRQYGSYNPQAALESMDDLTRRCVERLGFVNLCMSTNEAADRANFRMIYEQLAERQNKENLLPGSLKNLIEGIRHKELESKEN